MYARFHRMQQLDENLIDWDSRPHGDAFLLRHTVFPRYNLPPTIIIVGKCRSGFIFSPPINWYDWRPRYPIIPFDKVVKNYLPVPRERVRVRYNFCEDCGHHTVFSGFCLLCHKKLEMEFEQREEIKAELRKMFASYLRLLDKR